MTISRTAPRRLPLADIPELSRPVAMHGRLGQAEVGGSACFGVIVAVIASPHT